jgi:hypothetical protein
MEPTRGPRRSIYLHVHDLAEWQVLHAGVATGQDKD